MSFWVGLILGFLVGGMCGAGIMCLCFARKEDEEDSNE